MLFHSFRSEVKLDMTLAPLRFDTNNICSAVFTLAIKRLHSFKRQPFWFHNLNSMVPVKGTVLFNLVFFFFFFFLSHLFFLFILLL